MQYTFRKVVACSSDSITKFVKAMRCVSTARLVDLKMWQWTTTLSKTVQEGLSVGQEQNMVLTQHCVAKTTRQFFIRSYLKLKNPDHQIPLK